MLLVSLKVIAINRRLLGKAGGDMFRLGENRNVPGVIYCVNSEVSRAASVK